jgi:hypothetical protein
MTPSPPPERYGDTAPLLPAPATQPTPACDPFLCHIGCMDIAWLDAGLCCEALGAVAHCAGEVLGALGHACADALPALLEACEGFGACCHGW